MWNVSSSLVHKWSVRLLLTLEKFIRCLNRILESIDITVDFPFTLQAMVDLSCFFWIICNLHMQILKWIKWFVKLNLFVWLIQCTWAVSLFLSFFFHLAKLNM